MTDAPPPIQPSVPPPLPPTTMPANPVRRSTPRDAWSRFQPVLWVFGSLLAAAVAVSLVGRSDRSPMPDCVLTLMIAAIGAGLAVAERRTIVPLLVIRVPAREWLFTLATFVAMALVVTGYFWLVQFVFELLAMLEPFRESGWPPWSAVVLCVVCPAIFEELIFRGFLLERLIPLLGRRDAWLLQGSLFAIIHLAPASLPSHFVMGLVLGHLRLRTGSLLPGMCVHAAWNFTVLVQEGLLAGW